MKNHAILLLICLLFANGLLGQGSYFLANEVLLYDFAYLSPAGDTVAKGEIVITPTNEKWEHDASQKRVMYEYIFAHRDAKYFTKGLHGRPIENEQMETTGYNEGDRFFWTHPFRANIFYITQVAPFPEYVKGNGKVKVKNTLVIDKGWGKFAGTSKSNYKMSAHSKELPGFEGHKLKKVDMRSKHPLGKSCLSMIVADEIGILKMDYKFFNKDRLFVSLVKKGDRRFR